MNIEAYDVDSLRKIVGMLANVDKTARPKLWKKKCEFFKADVSNQRETGHPIRVSFKVDLRTQQELAAEKYCHIQMVF
ncbi:MAG: hypothetical protein ACI4DV_02075 [Lachnospiraceae bacterium]